MEAFDLAVGLRPVGPSPLVDGAACSQRSSKDAGAVVEAVVAQTADDANTAAGEPGRCPGLEVRGAPALLIGKDLGVGQAGLVVQDGVQVAVATAALHVRTGLLAVNVPAAVGMRPSFLTSMFTRSPGAGCS